MERTGLGVHGKRKRFWGAAVILMLASLSGGWSGVALAEARPGSIQVTSTPPGASLYLDGEPTGEVTPAVLGDLAPGQYVVTAVLGSLSAEEIVVARAGKKSVVELNLTMNLSVLKVTSHPAGATVTVDGLSEGETPNTLYVEAGKHSLMFARKGCCNAEVEVDVIPGGTEVHQELVPCATLRITAEPAEAEVLIDGLLAGSGKATMALPLGEHKIIVRSPGHADYVRELNVNRSDPITRHVVLVNFADQAREASSAKKARKVWFWTSVGLAAAGVLGAGTGLGLMFYEDSEADRDKERYSEARFGSYVESMYHDAYKNHQDSAQMWQTVGLGCGVVALLAGGSMLLAALPEPRLFDGTDSKGPGISLYSVPMDGQGFGAGLSVTY